jgi:hypothetical protein
MFFSFSRFATFSERRRFYFDVAFYFYNSLTEVPRWQFVEVQIVELQLSDSDSSAGNKCEKSPQHEKNYCYKTSTLSGDWKIKQRAEFAFCLLSLQNKEISDKLC